MKVGEAIDILEKHISCLEDDRCLKEHRECDACPYTTNPISNLIAMGTLVALVKDMGVNKDLEINVKWDSNKLVINYIGGSDA